jgi:hypothetical protein
VNIKYIRVPAAALLFAWVSLTLGCFEPAKQAKVAVPPPPAPAALQDPPALVAPQTIAELPDPQPVPEQAVPVRPVPSLTPADASSTAARATPRRNAAAESDSAEKAAGAPVQPPARATNNRPALVAADPNVPSVDTIHKRIAHVEALDAQIRARPMPEDVKMIHNRIQYFLEQARRALERKDLREADSLSNRARVLAEDLAGGR